jgi:hypothetical protein
MGPVKARSNTDGTIALLPRKGGKLTKRVALAHAAIAIQGWSLFVQAERGGEVWEMLLTPIPTPDADSSLRS